MGRLLIRAQLCRFTSRIEAYHRSLSFASTILPFTRFRQCSTSPDSKTTNIPLSPKPRNYGEEIEKERAEKHSMVQKLSRNVEILTCQSSAEAGVCDVYLVGTVHISQKSCKEVQAIINFLKPKVVFLELCSSRKAVLTSQSLKEPTVEEMIKSLKKQPNFFGELLSFFYAKVASQLKVIPGSEFRVAYEEANKYGGRVVLGDRPVKITITRTWRKMPLWQKTKLLYCLLFQGTSLPIHEVLNKVLKKMEDNVDMVIQEMRKEFPSLIETLVDERDQYMSSTLLKVASKSSSVVAVVGMGHLQGIKKHWKQPVVLEDLETIPAKSAVSLTKVGVVVAGVATISCIYLSSKT